MLRFIQIQFILIMFVIIFAKELPNNLIPIEYKLQIITNIGDKDDIFSFVGSVLIHIKCISSTDSIILHSKNLKVDAAKTALRNLNQTEDSLTISETIQDPEHDFLVLTVSKTLQTGLHYAVELYFKGDLKEEKVGYYRTSYQDKDGEEKWVAVTYFKPNNARRAFPCFDELTFKANFTVSLGRSIKFNSLSNMPLRKTEKMEGESGWEWDHFETTPLMPTYTLAFAVTDFKHDTLESNGKDLVIDLGVSGTDVIMEHSDLILGLNAKFLRSAQESLGMKYPLPKLDLIAIPEYAVPAMEGWGLVIWEEGHLEQLPTTLLFNPEVVRIVADQMVRQLFGNLVTMKSWSDLGFIEGLHMYLSNVIFNTAMKRHADLFLTDTIITSVFDFDALQNSQAVSANSDPFEHFDKITHHDAHKNSFHLIRMLSHLLGQEHLQMIIRSYLTTYAYKNAGHKELLKLNEDFSSFPNIDLHTVMDSWFSQMGFPLVTVTRNYKRNTIKVKQERFFRDSRLLGTDATRWWIPLTYTTECEFNFNRTVRKRWLTPTKDSITIRGPISSADFVIFNTDASGLYMVNYDEENWNRIIDFLNYPFYKHMPQLNRILLIDNAASLAWIGRLDYKIFFNLIKYLGIKQEKSIVPQGGAEGDINTEYVALRALYDLNALLKRRSVHQRFKLYVREIFHEMSERAQSLNLEMHVNKDNLQSKRHHHHTGILAIVSETMVMRELILCNGDAEKEYPWSEYVANKETEEKKLLILRTLPCCRNETLLGDYLKNSLHEEGGKELALIITGVAANKNGFALVTQFLNENIKSILDRISPHFDMLALPVVEIARQIISEDELKWLKDFIDTNQDHFKAVKIRLEEVLEIAKLSVQWHKNNYRTIEAYFEDSNKHN